MVRNLVDGDVPKQKTTANKQNRLMLLVFLILGVSNSYAHKDRIERPQTYRFIFADGDTIQLNKPKDSLLAVLSNDIVNNKRRLIEAQLTFNTGEILTFNRAATVWTSIKIMYNRKVIFIPQTTIQKIPGIHFQDIALLWNGNNGHNAFEASYFYIEFNIGQQKSFGIFPRLQLYFTEKEFFKARISKQISENTKQQTVY